MLRYLSRHITTHSTTAVGRGPAVGFAAPGHAQVYLVATGTCSQHTHVLGFGWLHEGGGPPETRPNTEQKGNRTLGDGALGDLGSDGAGC